MGDGDLNAISPEWTTQARVCVAHSGLILYQGIDPGLMPWAIERRAVGARCAYLLPRK